MIIALPKGVVLHRSMEIVRRLTGTEIDSRKLSFLDHREFQFLLAKHRDVPLLLKEGLVDIGITSTDWVVERALEWEPFMRLDWCDTRVSLIGRSPMCHDLETPDELLCVTEFPRITSAYLTSHPLAEKVRVVHVSGSIEALVSSVCDLGVDCVETGSTLRSNGLHEVEVILQTGTLAFARPGAAHLASAFMSAMSDIGEAICEPSC